MMVIDSPAPASELWEVAVALPLFHPLTYRLPAALTAQVGSLVRVPVGRRQVTGYLLGPTLEAPPGTLRDIREVLDPIPRFGPAMVPLFRWVADYYQYPLGEALSFIIPGAATPVRPRRELWACPLDQPQGEPLPSRLGPKSRALLEYLRESGPTAVTDLQARFPACRDSLRRLAARALIGLEDRACFRAPLDETPPPLEEARLTLVPDQEKALGAIIQGIDEHVFAPFLLHGVTASGKTEVYLAAAAHTLAQGRQVLVLAPEIALTHPVARAFQQRFGPRVALLHSGLSESCRAEQWRRLSAGEADIVVGARSAVFAPLPRLGLVVVDEEHDPSYKQEGGLLYQARDVALYRGKLAAAAVVLVSATPQVTTYYHALEGKYQYLNLARRVTPQSLPDIRLVDLRAQRGEPALKIISRPLLTALEEVLGRGEQALLFLNRRGYARAVFCLFCGRVFECHQCSVALTHHRAQDRLVCHYCGYSAAVPERCPHCQSTAIKRYGAGTEKVESELKRLLPQARVARLDRDTAPDSRRALKVLDDFAAGNLDLLVGTQMITKGHHFPQVTLVGVIAADLSLFFPEYHAGERTFQLLSQVAGRAGRGAAKGTVIIQTYQPDHYVFQTVQSQDYQAFFDRELQSRRQLGYPPFTRLALVRISGLEEEPVAREARRLAAALERLRTQDQDLRARVRLLGPAPAGLTRLQGRFRWQILIKSCGRPALLKLLLHLRQAWIAAPRSRLSLSLDIDPATLF
ncbi:MAG: primosomal protein N' [Syntrophobacterales bacterium]|jgi:primosomal protein N' (replication factor Y)|nr:primosomal protein N' [Syntrophobacterales bacterium]